jgi:hypothetical protein
MRALDSICASFLQRLSGERKTVREPASRVNLDRNGLAPEDSARIADGAVRRASQRLPCPSLIAFHFDFIIDDHET